MRVGIPTEVKNHEYRVAMTPAGVYALTRRGHRVIVQSGAGLGSGIPDDDYAGAGAELGTVDQVWASADLIVKVKEPVAAEYPRLRSDQQLFTYLHLAADRPLTERLLDAEVTAIAYETVQTAGGRLPLLAPMSEIAGRLAVHAGIYHLQTSQGGSGILASGVPGVEAAEVLVIGGGAAGENALRQAAGLGANVTVLDISVDRLRELDRLYGDRVTTLASTEYALQKAAKRADLIIGAALVPGARAPQLISSGLAHELRAGTVLVDIAIDQGGCFADSRPTTHSDPVYRVGDATFYAVANMPGAVPRTSTAALTNVTLPYIAAVADRGWQNALADDPALARGLNVTAGAIAHPDVARAYPELPSCETASVLAENAAVGSGASA